ncbi:MAG: hypothetical protein WD044_10310 [Dongiaceae bacterium]
MAMRRDDPAGPQLAERASDSAATWPVRGSGLFVWSARLFLAAILLTLGVQFLLVFRININWDEFHFLSFAYEYARGGLTARLQTLHVHLFAWLPGSRAIEIDEIVAGRLVMATLACGSAMLIYAIARRFLSRRAALFGLLAYLSVDSVTLHAASFRTDPLATLLCLIALFLLLRPLPRAGDVTGPGAGRITVAGAALAGIVMAIALMVTVKSVFYLVTIGLALLCLAPRWPVRLRLALAFGVPFAIAFAALFTLHGALLTSAVADAAPTAGGSGAFDTIVNFLHGAGSKMFIEDGLLARWRVLLLSLIGNPPFWILTSCGAWLAWQQTRTAGTEPRERPTGWLALALAFPVVTPFFYRNAFDYNFVFILPPAAILAGFAYEHLWRMVRARGNFVTRTLLAIVVLGPCVLLARNIVTALPDRIAPQRTVIAAVHQVFAEPVLYLDGYGVVARFPRVGFFHSGWGVDRYREAGGPVYPELVAAMQPPLLLADSPSLYGALVPAISIVEDRLLLPEDAAFLAAHYLQYWGMIFVVGQTVTIPESGGSVDFDIVVAGEYRIGAGGPVRIDGAPLQPGAVMRLETGPHELAAAPGNVVLRWADLGPAPDAAPVGLLEFFDVAP